MQKENPNVYIPQQFVNPKNPEVHRHHTGLEILEQVAGDIHGFCSGIGTGGTLSGIGETLKKQYPDIDKALKAGREIIDYKVENALLKSALGYKTKEVSLRAYFFCFKKIICYICVSKN